jgi:hypothetical protein
MKLSTAASNIDNNKRRRYNQHQSVNKLIYKKNTDVYAAFWQDDDIDRIEEPYYYKGVVVATRETNHENIRRVYDIKYDDGDTAIGIPESLVFLEEEYQLRMQYDDYDNYDGNLLCNGDVKFHVDENSTDDWYKFTGWYSICINTKRIHFPLLSLALKAHDDHIKKNSSGKESITHLDNSLPTNGMVLLPPPARRPQIDYLGPHYRHVSDEGPCYITKATSPSSQRLRLVFDNGNVAANANFRTRRRDRICDKKKKNKQDTMLDNIANIDNLTPYPKCDIINRGYRVFCDGGKDDNNAIDLPNGSKPEKVISIRHGHLFVIDIPNDKKGVMYRLRNHSSDIIMPPRASTKECMLTTKNHVTSLFAALEDITNQYTASFTRGAGQCISLDNNLEGKNSYYICAGTYANRQGGVSSYNKAFAMSDERSQLRMLKLFQNIENSWQEWIDRKHLK